MIVLVGSLYPLHYHIIKFGTKITKNQEKRFYTEQNSKRVVSLVFNSCIGLLSALAVSIGKELYDKYSGKGNAEWEDLVADLVGIAIGLLSVYLINSKCVPM